MTNLTRMATLHDLIRLRDAEISKLQRDCAELVKQLEHEREQHAMQIEKLQQLLNAKEKS